MIQSKCDRCALRRPAALLGLLTFAVTAHSQEGTDPPEIKRMLHRHTDDGN